MTIPATPRPWIVTFDVPTAVIPGHTIYDGKAPHTPIASLWVGGGASGKPRQRANAALIVEAVNAYDRLREENATLQSRLDKALGVAFELGANNAEMHHALAALLDIEKKEWPNYIRQEFAAARALLAKMEAAK